MVRETGVRLGKKESLRYLSVSLGYLSVSLRYISVSLPELPSPISYYFPVIHTLKIQNDTWHSPFLSAVSKGTPFIDPVLQFAVFLKVCAISLKVVELAVLMPRDNSVGNSWYPAMPTEPPPFSGPVLSPQRLNTHTKSCRHSLHTVQLNTTQSPEALTAHGATQLPPPDTLQLSLQRVLLYKTSHLYRSSKVTHK